MRPLRVALAQLAPRLGDLARNFERHLTWVEQARQDGAKLIVFPELSLTGYVLRDLTPEVALRAGAPALRRLARASREIDIVAGFVEEAKGHRFHNSAGYFHRGRLVHVHRKLYLPTYGLFQEGRDLAPGDALRAFPTSRARIGLLVCEDAWHPTCAWLLAQDGAELLLVVANGPTRGTRAGQGITSLAVWEQLVRVTAQFQTTPIVFVNRVGVEDGLSFGGGSLAVDAFGRVIARLPALEEALVSVDLDPDVLRRARTAYPLLRDENVELVRRELERIRDLRYELEPRSRRRGPRR